jgi:hypothetical protein
MNGQKPTRRFLGSFIGETQRPRGATDPAVLLAAVLDAYPEIELSIALQRRSAPAGCRRRR